MKKDNGVIEIVYINYFNLTQRCKMKIVLNKTTPVYTMKEVRGIKSLCFYSH